MRFVIIVVFTFFIRAILFAQADNEIQVYASPTIQHKWTIFELHSNYTFKGSKLLTDPKSAHWANKTLEITHGFGKNFEIGLYTFTGIAPGGGYQYLGNQIRPRVTVPNSWKWAVGASISLEFGFFRPDDTTKFAAQGELRPIIDKTIDNWYIAFNPNIDFVLTGDNKGAGISPQIKTVYTIRKKFGIGFEYYGGLGSFKDILPIHLQEHLIGPMIDLYVHPKWEINTGFLFGLTQNSNQRILKILLGKRIGK
ncbi:MAG TPA: hypothetical protein VJU78_08935 [Chitinophagaceae bacterium]|nr:hypothetical protein [Chitinophagaceae bacterium]